MAKTGDIVSLSWIPDDEWVYLAYCGVNVFVKEDGSDYLYCVNMRGPFITVKRKGQLTRDEVFKIFRRARNSEHPIRLSVADLTIRAIRARKRPRYRPGSAQSL